MNKIELLLILSYLWALLILVNYVRVIEFQAFSYVY